MSTVKGAGDGVAIFNYCYHFHLPLFTQLISSVDEFYVAHTCLFINTWTDNLLTQDLPPPSVPFLWWKKPALMMYVSHTRVFLVLITRASFDIHLSAR